MNKQTKKDIVIIGAGVGIFFALLILGRQEPMTDLQFGGKWCSHKNQILDKVYPTTTKRGPYYTGEFKPQLKLVVICKKKALH